MPSCGPGGTAALKAVTGQAPDSTAGPRTGPRIGEVAVPPTRPSAPGDA
ncbi:hypothetical protein [Sphaerisporangium siamense]|uniref:Uncharacterized protein n=1 Tax=Sphaerisporangium siamense TaxID=795645 RepID=A0A7W7GBV8_9ACTN|nr:hypothetical protein [Sphaerisporangium siamense]MBB4703897.1 hypothetical protein [Sphaerisporangium siamense]